MSKIEKALHRARGERTLHLVPKSGGATQLPATVSGQAVGPEQRAQASREIALMQEPQLRARTALEQQRIIHPDLRESGTVQAFREIRTKIIQRSGGRNCTIVVTSLDATAGTSFVAFNLGVAFAFDSGKTALVMDCNLRNPSFHRFVLGDRYHGITDYLENPDMDPAEIIYPVGIPRLRVVPAGGNREVPVEYFTSARMQQLMQTMKQRYLERYIILDAPPMIQPADVQILLELCDYAVLVVPYGKVTEARLAECAKAIGEQKLLGVVFNDVPRPPRIADLLRSALLPRAFRRKQRT